MGKLSDDNTLNVYWVLDSTLKSKKLLKGNITLSQSQVGYLTSMTFPIWLLSICLNACVANGRCYRIECPANWARQSSKICRQIPSSWAVFMTRVIEKRIIISKLSSNRISPLSPHNACSPCHNARLTSPCSNHNHVINGWPYVWLHMVEKARISQGQLLLATHA